jgi:hypothetical protein
LLALRINLYLAGALKGRIFKPQIESADTSE